MKSIKPMHLFFDTVWKLHIGEIPEKPKYRNFEKVGRITLHDTKKYNEAIAAIKQNALTVGNPEIFSPIFEEDRVYLLLPLSKCFATPRSTKQFHRDDFIEWPGGYETLKTLHCDEYHQHTKNSCFTTIAILTLPEEKNTKHQTMKFRKKAVVIEAMQWPGYTSKEIQDFVGDSLKSEERDGIGVSGFFIVTLEGNSYWLHKNDWIIKGVAGEFYPCKPDIFEKTYEPVVPEEKKNTMENMTKEHLTEVQKYKVLNRTSFKNVSGNWQFNGDMTPERFIKILFTVLEESGSVAAPKEDGRDALIKAQSDYIDFLSSAIVQPVSFLHTHNWNYSEEDIEKGKKLREVIEKARKLISK